MPVQKIALDHVPGDVPGRMGRVLGWEARDTGTGDHLLSFIRDNPAEHSGCQSPLNKKVSLLSRKYLSRGTLQR